MPEVNAKVYREARRFPTTTGTHTGVDDQMTRPRSTETQFPEEKQIIHDVSDLLRELQVHLGKQMSPSDVIRLQSDVDDMQVRLAGRITGGVMNF